MRDIESLLNQIRLKFRQLQTGAFYHIFNPLLVLPNEKETILHTRHQVCILYEFHNLEKGMCIYGIYMKYVWNIHGILKLKLELTLWIISNNNIFVIPRLTQIECTSVDVYVFFITSCKPFCVIIYKHKSILMH